MPTKYLGMGNDAGIAATSRPLLGGEEGPPASSSMCCRQLYLSLVLTPMADALAPRCVDSKPHVTARPLHEHYLEGFGRPEP